MKYEIPNDSNLIPLYHEVVEALKKIDLAEEYTTFRFLRYFDELNKQVYLLTGAKSADAIADFYSKLSNVSQYVPNTIENNIYQHLINMVTNFTQFKSEKNQEQEQQKAAELSHGLYFFLPEISSKLDNKEIFIPYQANIQIAKNYIEQLELVKQDISKATLLSNDIMRLEFDSSFFSSTSANYYNAAQLGQLDSDKIDTLTQKAGEIVSRLKMCKTDQFSKDDEREIGRLERENIYRIDPALPKKLTTNAVKEFLKRKNDISESNCNLILSLLLQERIDIIFKWLDSFLMPLTDDNIDFENKIKHSSQISVNTTYNEIASATLNFELPIVSGVANKEIVGKSSFSITVKSVGEIEFSSITAELYDTAKSKLGELQNALNDKQNAFYKNTTISAATVEIESQQNDKPLLNNKPINLWQKTTNFIKNIVNKIRSLYEYVGLLKPKAKLKLVEKRINISIKPDQRNLLQPSQSVMLAEAIDNSVKVLAVLKEIKKESIACLLVPDITKQPEHEELEKTEKVDNNSPKNLFLNSK